MANPITWRNVGSADNRASNALMTQGQQTIQEGIGGISSAVSAFGNRLGKQEEELTRKNTDAFLQRIKGIDDLGDYNRLKQEGAFGVDTLAGQNVDQNAIVDAFGARQGSIQRELVEGQQFDDQQRNYAFTDLREAIALKTANGEFDAARGLLKEDDPMAAKQLTAIQAGEDAWNLREEANQTKIAAAAKKERDAGINKLTSQFTEAARFTPDREVIDEYTAYLANPELGLTVDEQNAHLTSFNTTLGLRSAKTAKEEELITSSNMRVQNELTTLKNEATKLEKEAGQYQAATPEEQALGAIDVINSVDTLIPAGTDVLTTGEFSIGDLRDKVGNTMQTKQVIDYSPTGKATGIRDATEEELAAGEGFKIEPYQMRRALTRSLKEGDFFTGDYIKKDKLSSVLLDEVIQGQRGQLASEKAALADETYRTLQSQSADVAGSPDGAASIKEIVAKYKASQERLSQKPVEVIKKRKDGIKAAAEKAEKERKATNVWRADSESDQIDKAARLQRDLERFRSRF